MLGTMLFCGCAGTYIPPSGRADLSAIANIPPSDKTNNSSITGSTMQESFAAKPAAGFPAGIAAVHVQAPHYRSYLTDAEGGVYGEGRYSVITTKETEDDADMERLSHLPDVGGLISVSTLLLPRRLESDRDLREAAAKLKADMVLIYTFDTSFHNNDLSIPLNVVTLGLTPTRQVFVNVTASALLIDTRTGFIYAAIEANEKRKVLSNAWLSQDTADRARRNAEKAAFKGLVGQFETNWPKVVERAKKGT